MQKGASWPKVNTTATRVSFEEETSIAVPERANPLSSISSVPACCWQGKSLPGCVRGADGSSEQRMEGCPPHTHLGHRGVHCSWVGTWCYTPHSLGTPLPKQPETAMSSGSYSIGLCLCSSSCKTFMAPLLLTCQQSRRDTWLWPLGVGTIITLVPWCVHRVQSQAPTGARSRTPACQPPQHPHDC